MTIIDLVEGTMVCHQFGYTTDPVSALEHFSHLLNDISAELLRRSKQMLQASTDNPQRLLDFWQNRCYTLSIVYPEYIGAAT